MGQDTVIPFPSWNNMSHRSGRKNIQKDNREKYLSAILAVKCLIGVTMLNKLFKLLRMNFEAGGLQLWG